MQINVNLKDADKVAAMVAAIRKQLPYATAVALTRTAQHAQKRLEQEMPKAFDSPTAWTLKSIRIKSARKTDLQAIVAIKDQAARGNPALFWLAPEIFGGRRSDKRAEALLKRADLLAPGLQAVPGKEAALNRFGNMTKASIVNAINGAKAAEDGQQQDGRSKYFVMRRGGQAIGIAARFSKPRMGMVLAFVRSGSYERRFDFYGTAQKAVTAVYREELNKAINQAIETAK